MPFPAIQQPAPEFKVSALLPNKVQFRIFRLIDCHCKVIDHPSSYLLGVQGYCPYGLPWQVGRLLLVPFGLHLRVPH